MEDYFAKLIASLIMASPMIIFYGATNDVRVRLETRKMYQRKKITKVTISSSLKQKYDDIKLDQIDNKKFREAASEFARVLINNFSKEDLVNFYNNISELEIRRNPFLIMLGAGGQYNPTNNVIVIFDSKTIYHELFHMASGKHNTKEQKHYDGLSQYKVSKEEGMPIGRALNEGYTEVLAKRYFGDKHKEVKAYEYETDIARKLEAIIGKDKMESFYLRADLNGLIDELKQYLPEEDILKFITRLDIINTYDTFHKSIRVRESIFDTYEFLLKSYTLKLKKDYEAGLIDIDTVRYLTKAYLESFKDKVNNGLFNYKLRNIDEMYKIMLTNLAEESRSRNVR